MRSFAMWLIDNVPIGRLAPHVLGYALKSKPNGRWTDQDKVRSRYPHASAEQESTGEWCAWDISHDERKRLNEKHYPETFGRGLLGLGRTEAEAWADAVRTIEQREGRRLPVPNVK